MGQCYTPGCYFPSTVMFIDDSKDFLINFSLQLDEMLTYQLYDSPYDALKALQISQQPEQLSQRSIKAEFTSEGCPLTTQTVNLDLAAIHWEAYNPQRFSEISAVVVDYAMPGLDGIELCKRIQSSPVKKILLTGRADEKTAIEAFNDGLIDAYVQKHDPNITTLINKTIKKLQFRYFQEMSDVIVKMLSVHGLRCLQDRKFGDFFHKLCKDRNIVEYYLTENTGSFLLLDAEANPTCLIVKNESDLQYCYELAVDNNAPQVITEQLREGKAVPYFWQADGAYQSNWTDWSTALHPAQKLECDETYYYAVIDNALAFDIQPNKILSYHDFLERQDVSVEQFT